MQKIIVFYVFIASSLVYASDDDFFVGTDLYDPDVYKRHRSYCESKRYDIAEKNRKMQNILKFLQRNRDKTKKIEDQQTINKKEESPPACIFSIGTGLGQLVYEYKDRQKNLNIIFEALQTYDAHLPPLKLSAYKKQVGSNRFVNRWNPVWQEHKLCASKEKGAFCKKNKIKHSAHHQKQPNKGSKR